MGHGDAQKAAYKTAQMNKIGKAAVETSVERVLDDCYKCRVVLRQKQEGEAAGNVGEYALERNENIESLAKELKSYMKKNGVVCTNQETIWGVVSANDRRPAISVMVGSEAQGELFKQTMANLLAAAKEAVVEI